MAHGGSTLTGWYAVAPAVGVGTTPVPVAAGDRAYVLVRLQPGGEVSAFPARCPHRLVPLRTATVDGDACSARHTAGGSTPRGAAWTSPRWALPAPRRHGPTWRC